MTFPCGSGEWDWYGVYVWKPCRDLCIMQDNWNAQKCRDMEHWSVRCGLNRINFEGNRDGKSNHGRDKKGGMG
jgi:hypothetical protein